MSKQSKMTGADYLLLLLYLDNCSAINGAIRITKIYYFSKSVLEHDFAHKDYQAFFGYLKKHRTIEPPTIITTNWDTLIESYCNKYSVDYSYGFLQPYTSDSIKHTAKNYDLLLLKIHGSANWLRCLNCGSIRFLYKGIIINHNKNRANLH